MTLLHELLACESDLENKKKKIHSETISTFTKKTEHFVAWNKKLKMFDESRINEETEENHELVSTVKEKLDYIRSSYIDFWDLKLKKELSNQKATGDFSINGLKVNHLPVSFLLTMEKELKILRELFNEIPTLSPGITWAKDEIKKEGVYKSIKPIIRKKTEKKTLPLVLAEATKEHKAQVATITEERPVGDYIEERWSGMLSPAEKSKYLERIDNLILEFKKARQRANSIEAIIETIGNKIFDYILA